MIQEHFILEEGQETNDYCGWANVLECYFGLHSEHHDFPGIPWNRLPRLRRLAAEAYVPQPSFRSRLLLLVAFLSDPAWTLHRNTVRVRSGAEATVAAA